MQNVRLKLLLPNATSRVQPLNTGINAWVKAKYRCRLLFRIFVNLDVGKKIIYNVDILKALRWTYEDGVSFLVDFIAFIII